MSAKPIYMTISIVLALTLGFQLADQANGQESTDDAIAISRGPQLFLDDYLVARTANLKRRMQQPKRHPANPLLVQEFPWEKRTIQLYGTVMFDPHAGKFRCWYLASSDPDAAPEYYICYAESPDGIRWKKPMVGAAGLLGYERHNVVVPGGHGICVLRTPHDPDPGTRYKGLGGDMLAFSADGINWSMERFKAAGKNDTGSSVVFWKGEYLAYVRNQHPDPDWPGVMRAVALSTSTDFKSWTPKKTIFLSDQRDGYPWVQPYGLEVTAYGDQLIGLLPLLHLDRKQGNNSLGDMKIQLVAGRDGRSWTRVADRATFMEHTPSVENRTWDSEYIFPATTMFVKDDLVHVYYTGYDSRHGDGIVARKGIGLATLPADRFVALVPSPGGTEGVLETMPLSLPGGELLVNARVPPGGLEVELLDQRGNVPEGFGRKQCRLLAHDPLRYRVVWESEGNTRPIGQAPLKTPALRFVLRKGELYAFQVAK